MYSLCVCISMRMTCGRLCVECIILWPREWRIGSSVVYFVYKYAEWRARSNFSSASSFIFVFEKKKYIFFAIAVPHNLWLEVLHCVCASPTFIQMRAQPSFCVSLVHDKSKKIWKLFNVIFFVLVAIVFGILILRCERISSGSCTAPQTQYNIYICLSCAFDPIWIH